MEQKEKSEKPPALYDLTTLQRDANRQLGYTAQQTLDYLQALYEKKLCTYPRTDSRYLTADMEGTVPALAAAAAKICGVAVPDTVLAAQVCNSAKVTDHHAIVPTEGAGRTDVEALPAGEREILRLVARELLCATGSPYRYQGNGCHSGPAAGTSFLPKERPSPLRAGKPISGKRQTRQKKASYRTD